MSKEVANLINSALAALTQNATFPPDVEFAKNRLREALSLLTPLALDTGCRCDLQDSPNAPADWHGENCPCYRPRQ